MPDIFTWFSVVLMMWQYTLPIFLVGVLTGIFLTRVLGPLLGFFLGQRGPGR